MVMIVNHTLLDLGDRQTPVEIRINKRAKRLILKVDAIRCCAVVTAPSKSAIPEAIRFAQSRASWVRSQLNEGGQAMPFTPGAQCPYRGKNLVIKNEGGPRARIELQWIKQEGMDGVLNVGGDPSHTNRRVVDWLKKQAKRTLTQQTDEYCNQLDVKRGPITIRDTKSRWGSCANNGALSFSWRLIMTPPWILAYVAAHECAHLVHLNHSPEYWRTLATINPDVDAAKIWFRDYGETLHGYGIEYKQ